jgi:hypothetical protein
VSSPQITSQCIEAPSIQPTSSQPLPPLPPLKKGKLFCCCKRGDYRIIEIVFASLLAGIVFSPPSVRFSMFGEEDAFTPTVRDKSLPNVHG